MYTIGEFSRITSITVKALRLYHEKGLLRPSFIDKSTNYRYYSNQDVERANLIVVLKSMKFSLSEIQAVLAEINEEADLTQVLAEKKEKITREIASLNTISSAIDVILIKEKEALKMTATSDGVQRKALPDIDVITTQWQGKYSDTGKAMGKIYKAVGRHAAGPAFNLYFDGEYKDIATVESCLPVKKQIKSNLTFKQLKGGMFYTLIHIGPYENIGSSYAKIFEHIKTNGDTATTPGREVYIKGPGLLFKGKPEKYITEIQIPIVESQID